MATEMKSDFGESMSMYHLNEATRCFKPFTRTPSISSFYSLVSKEKSVDDNDQDHDMDDYSYTNHAREHMLDIYKRALRGSLLSNWMMNVEFPSNDIFFKIPLVPHEEDDILVSYNLSSTLKKRKKKMNKHKYQKLRKRTRALRRRLGK